MIRRIIKIDTDQCNGCGACAAACHEGAIEMVNGKATLARESYCDGLGDCLPECPTGAIRFEEREAPAYDEAAVLASKREKAVHGHADCPGAQMRQMQRACAETAEEAKALPSRLAQWPCQIRLAPVTAPYFADADLLVAADCTAFAYANMHESYMKGRITLIGCPKLDAVDYSEKLTLILRQNEIRSVTVLRMEVPCCGGLMMAAQKAVQACGREIPFRVVTVSIDGHILEA